MLALPTRTIFKSLNLSTYFRTTQENLADITSEYWPAADIGSRLFPVKFPVKTAYVCVFNNGRWRITWWGKIQGDSAAFKSMCKGAVFLPAYYYQGRIIPAGHPIASGYNNKLVLAPDTLHKRNITLSEQEKYLIYQPGKRYTLYYWDKVWKALGEKTALQGQYDLVFSKVPANALFILIPEYSQGKERPFMITPEGKRVWW